MARIRTIKPEFWRDEKLSMLNPIDRLVFLGLISMADDYGRVHDNVKVIDAFVFPNSDDSVRESLANLSRMNRIRRGNSSSGMTIIEIVNWEKHQKVDKPQPKLALPPISNDSVKNNEKPNDSTVREQFANDSRTTRESVAPLTPTYDPDPDHDLRPTTEDRVANRSRKVSDNPPTLEDIENYIGYIGKDATQAESIYDFYCANGWVQGSKGKPLIDWQAAVRAWFRNDLSKTVSTRGSPGNTFAQQRLKNTQQAIEEFASDN